jgi:hypothetical protein
MTSTKRKYTGLHEGYARGRRAGTDFLANGITWLTAGKLWNNGTYGIRPNHSNMAVPSVHATGRAADISRRAFDPHPGSDRAFISSWCDLLTRYADEFGLEMIIDYGHGPNGRIWMCDRAAWIDATPGYINGGGWGDWIHIELDPAHADSVALIQEAFDIALPKPKKAAAKKKA